MAIMDMLPVAVVEDYFITTIVQVQVSVVLVVVAEADLYDL
jgi:hypothetical protein